MYSADFDDTTANDTVSHHAQYQCASMRKRIDKDDEALGDTGATNHMFNNSKLFDQTTLKLDNSPNLEVSMAGGSE